MSTQMKYAYRRHNTWIYRRTYPVHLHDVLGSSLKRSLHTPDAKVAAKRVAAISPKRSHQSHSFVGCDWYLALKFSVFEISC